MFRALSVTNHLGETLRMDIFKPYESGMNIKDIDGIGPGKATINSIEMYGQDGSRFNSARLPQRDITITIEFLESPDIETVRQRTYRYFPLKKEVVLTFETDNNTLYTVGRVEGNLPKIFQQKESAVITVNCFDPMFRRVGNGSDGFIDFSTLEGGFEFPFQNPVDTRSLEFAKLVSKTMLTTIYEGTEDVGIVATLTAAYGPVVTPTLHNLTTGESITIDTTKIVGNLGFKAGDSIEVSTVVGAKSVTHIRNGVRTKTLKSVAPGSAWLKMVPGENVLAYSAKSGLTSLSVTIVHDTTFSGV